MESITRARPYHCWTSVLSSSETTINSGRNRLFRASRFDRSFTFHSDQGVDLFTPPHDEELYSVFGITVLEGEGMERSLFEEILVDLPQTEGKCGGGWSRASGGDQDPNELESFLPEGTGEV